MGAQWLDFEKWGAHVSRLLSGNHILCLCVVVWKQQHFRICFVCFNSTAFCLVWMYFCQVTVPFSFQCVPRPQGSVCQGTLPPSKHATIYNLAVRPSPAANHSALFDYSVEVNNNMLHDCKGGSVITVKSFMTSSKVSWLLDAVH